MKKLVVDLETYYDAQFSLSKMQTDAYILDPRYHTMGVSVQEDDNEPEWFSGNELATKQWLHKFPWVDSMAICHHALFDAFALTQRFGIKPKLWACTKFMSYCLYPHLRSYSLANLAKEFGLDDKGTVVHSMIGRTRESLTPEEVERYGEYCKLDVRLTKELSQKFLPHMPVLELAVIDMTIRMFTEPKFEGDKRLLQKLYDDEIERKALILAKSGLDKETLMSNPKLAKALQALGVEPPMKLSAKTGKFTYAFAKTDAGLTALLEHANPDVQALVSARLGVKSTIAETRAKTMLDTAMRGKLPVYLNYWGAKVTGRHSGGNDINWQNLPSRIAAVGVRDAIRAPAGHTIVVGDSSNIELRVAMFAAGQKDVMQKIVDGQDLYCDFASKMYGRIITKADKKERFMGKLAMLSLQYGAGHTKFREMVRQQTGDLIPERDAQDVVNLYRRVHYKIVDMWARMNDTILPEIANGCPNLLPVDVNAWCICAGEGFGVAGGPGVRYHNLQRAHREGRGGGMEMQWVYTLGAKEVKIYGGKAFENYCQHVARQIVMWQTTRIHRRFPVALSVHDEAVCVVRDDEVQECIDHATECLSTAPPWCRGNIPLACEIGHGATYGDAK
jgi:DNA polymerase